MIIGETSDWAFDTNGNRKHVDNGWPHGWPMGTGDSRQVVGRNQNTGGGEPQRWFNLTSIRWPVGTRDFSLAGVCDNKGSNNPLLSAHPGGAMIALTDGKVSFLANDTNMLVLKSLADRDDGQSVSF
jgi:hypothetical protein